MSILRQIFPNRTIGRSAKAGWRDSKLLLRQFAVPLSLFILAIVGGGVLYAYIANNIPGAMRIGNVEGIYIVLGLTFLEASNEFPDSWLLQLFHFLMPVIGIGVLAQGLTEFGLLFFNRRQRGKEWMMAVISTFDDHTILVGLGHLGFRVLKRLREAGAEVAVIEINPKAELLRQIDKLQSPVLEGDAKDNQTLLNAGIARASAIVICSNDDTLNLKIAFKARKFNPNIRVALRIWDDDFASTIEEQFGYHALSATAIASPAFAAAASGADITRPLIVQGETFSLGTLVANQRSQIVGMSAGDIEQQYGVSIVLLQNQQSSYKPPPADLKVQAGDHLGLLGSPVQINQLVNEN